MKQFSELELDFQRQRLEFVHTELDTARHSPRWQGRNAPWEITRARITT
jgi:hypothetical protein